MARSRLALALVAFAVVTGTVVGVRRWRAQRGDAEPLYENTLARARKVSPQLTVVLPILPFGLETRVPTSFRCASALVTSCEGDGGSVRWELDPGELDVDKTIAAVKSGPFEDDTWTFLAEQTLDGFRGVFLETHHGEKKGAHYTLHLFLGVREVPGRGPLVLRISTISQVSADENVAVMLATRIGPQGLTAKWPDSAERKRLAEIARRYRALSDDTLRPAFWAEAAAALTGADGDAGEKRRAEVRLALSGQAKSVPQLLEQRIDGMALSGQCDPFHEALRLVQVLRSWDGPAHVRKLGVLWGMVQAALAKPLAKPSDEIDWLDYGRRIVEAETKAGDTKADERLVALFLSRPMATLSTPKGLELIGALRDTPARERALEKVFGALQPPANADWFAVAGIARTLLGSKAVRAHVLVMLGDQRPHGEFEVGDNFTLTLRAGEATHSVTPGRPLNMPKKGSTGALRVCDHYALGFDGYLEAAPIRPWESLAARDVEIAKLRADIAKTPKPAAP